MFTYKVTYNDFDGNERTETLYFNLSKSELTELQLMFPGGYAEHIERVTDSADRPEILKMFKDLLSRSYGIKSDDGRRLVKSPEIFEEFTQTGAYDELFMKMCGDANFAADFVAGIMPDFGDPEKKAQVLSEAKAKMQLLEDTRKLIDQKKQESGQ